MSQDATKGGRMRKVNVIQNDESPVSADVLAEAIIEIAAAMKQIASSRLNRKALMVLVNYKTGVGMSSVSAVLDSLDSLERNYLKPKDKPHA